MEWVTCIFALLFSPRSVWKTGTPKLSVPQPSVSSNAKAYLTSWQKPRTPTEMDEKRCAIDTAIIRGCLRRMGVSLL